MEMVQNKIAGFHEKSASKLNAVQTMKRKLFTRNILKQKEEERRNKHFYFPVRNGG